MQLPAAYVHRHVDLGYALTVHRAQGITVDTAHVLAREGMTRAHLYVGLTRGRDANDVYTATDQGVVDHALAGVGESRTGRDVLHGVLAATGTEPAATTALRTAAAEAVSPERLRPVAGTLAADITRRRWTRLLAGHHDPNPAKQFHEVRENGVLYAALARAEATG